MEKMTQEVQEAIRKNLPSAVADVLQEYLKRAAVQEIECGNLKAENETARRLIAELRENISKSNAAMALHTKTQAQLEQELADLEKKILTVKLEEANRRSDNTFQLVHAIFRNPIVTKTVTGTIPIPVEGLPASQYNGGCSGMVFQSSIDTTTKIEKQ